MQNLVLILILPALICGQSVNINTDECGKSIGCITSPDGCSGAACTYIVTWKANTAASTVTIQLSVQSGGWAAMALSDDQLMGEDSVIECSLGQGNNPMIIQHSYNPAKSNSPTANPTAGITNAVGSYTGGRIICQFDRAFVVPGNPQVFDFNTPRYIFVGRGAMDTTPTYRKRYHSVTPIQSSSKIDLKTVSTGAAAAGNDMRVHGILMTLAWLSFANLGIFLARYYKMQWPEKKICNVKIWFCVHRPLMIAVTLITLISFIFAFILKGGWSDIRITDAKPGERSFSNAVRSHPYLGVIIMALALINPIMAIFRPGPDSPKRFIFNWAHWGVGTGAYVMGVVNVFFGINTPVASYIPFWLSWVLLGLFLVQLGLEIALEIYQCMNKPEKSNDMEMKSGSDSDDSAAKAEKFRFIILIFYLIVWITMTLTAVVTIAAAPARQ